MCGFAALFEPGRLFDAQLLAGMDADLFHRGPDSGGQLSEPGVALVFRRLAILDPEPVSDQPMTDASGRYTVVFNGEIYNFRELRRELEQMGRRFVTNGDTEVLLQGYAAWGEGVLDRLEGMYALVIVDRVESTAVAARDPLGIKPLYMARRSGGVFFASEMRPLTRLVGARPDVEALAELLTFGFAAGRLSNLEDIERVPGGTLVRIALDDGAIRERRFCDPLRTLKPDPGIDERTADEVAAASLFASLHAHLQSDVGYTVQLSGGVDSSLIAALTAGETAGQVRTFGIHLDGYAFDERPWREQVVARYGLDHQEVTLCGRDFADALPRALAHLEGPTAHYGCVLLMLLCDQVRQHSKVVLTGEGADEMFGGYMRYGLWRQLAVKTLAGGLVPPALWPFLRRRYREVERYAGRDAAIYGSVQHDFLAMFECFPSLIPAAGARERSAAGFGDFRSRLLAVDQSAYLESLLNRQDKMAMAASVEARVPFTHMPLARVVNRIPHALRIPGSRQTKPILKRIAAPYLPHDLLHRRKIGLVLPISEWAADEQALGRYLECLTAPDCRLASYTDAARLRSVVDRFRKGRRSGEPSVGQLINVELWLRSLDGMPAAAAA